MKIEWVFKKKKFRMKKRLRLGSYLFRELQHYMGVAMLEFK